MAKKNYFGPDFDPFWLKFGPKKMLQAIIVCNFKENEHTKLEKMGKIN